MAVYNNLLMDGALKDVQQLSRTGSKVLKYTLYWGFVPLIIGLAVYDMYESAQMMAPPPLK